MCLGIMILGLGVCIFKLSMLGNDPSSAFIMAASETAGISFSVGLIIFNAVCFVVEIIFGRKYIGAGTFVNWIFVGIFTDFFYGILSQYVTPDSLIQRLLVMIVGVFVLSFACSLYQTADVGIAPYDCISVVMAEKLPVPYFWCRIITDSACVLFALLFHGLIGIGTLICAVGLGPFISFFTKHAARKICGIKE